MRFAGRHAFVTGGGGGMGRRIAADLVTQGAAVTVVDVKPDPADWPDGPGRLRYRRCDLTDEPAVGEVIREAAAAFGDIGLLANVAGALWFGRDGSALAVDLAVWSEVITINLTTMTHTARHVVPQMRRRGGGAMVHFSSVQCLRGDPQPQDAYQVAKAGVIALSKSLAIQLAGENIRSNVVIPGMVMTPMQARWDDDPAAREAVARAVPLGRIGDTAELSAAALFLLSDDASYITGTELRVDGGLLARP